MSKKFIRLLAYLQVFSIFVLPPTGPATKRYPFVQNWVEYISRITEAKHPRIDDTVEDENLKALIELIETKYYDQITGEKDIRDIVKNRKRAFALIVKSLERYKHNRYREAVLFMAYQLGSSLPDLTDYTRLQRIKKKIMDDAAKIIRRDYYKNGMTLFSLMETLELSEYMGTTKDRKIWYNERPWRSKAHLRLSSQSYYNEILNLQRTAGDTAATSEAIRLCEMRNDFNNLVGVYYFAWKFSHGTQQLNYARKIQNIVKEIGRDFQFNSYAEGYISSIKQWLSRKLRAEIRTVDITSVSEVVLKDWKKFRFGSTNNPASDELIGASLRVAWQKNLKSPIFSSASIVDGLIYVGTDDGQVVAMDANLGRTIWSFRLGMGVESSPLINQGTLYIGNNDGFVYALDLTNQIIKWKTSIGDSCIGSPAYFNKRIYLGSYSYKSRIYCLDAETGEILWSVKSMNAVYSSPAIENGVVYIGSCGGILYALDAMNGEEVWQFDTIRSIYATPCLADGKVFFGSWSGEFVALDAKTGSLLWSFDSGAPINASAVYREGIVSCANDAGLIFALDAEKGSLAWKFNTKKQIFSSPIIIGNKIYYIPWDNNLYVIDLTSGKELFKFPVGSQVNSSLTYYGRLIYFGTDSGEFFALEEK